MIRVEAESLEEAYKNAASKLNCSVTDLVYEVVQNPKKGIFGLGKKMAVIIASCKKKEETKESPKVVEQAKTEAIKVEKPKESQNLVVKESVRVETKPKEEPKIVTPSIALEEIVVETPKVEEKPKNIVATNDEILDNFYHEKRDVKEVHDEIKENIKRLLSYTCFDIDRVEVSRFDEYTILIEFHGNDAALLIGKEGYRYKALSYMLFNWINAKYGLLIRLEIAEFLKNQEEMIRSYLAPLIDTIKVEGRGQTKPLDGVLAHIALKVLREEFPNKYVSFREHISGEKFVIINDFNRH